MNRFSFSRSLRGSADVVFCLFDALARSERLNGKGFRALAQVRDPVSNIPDALLLIADLAFDTQRSPVAYLLQ